jgi:Ras-related protein Rab-6A
MYIEDRVITLNLWDTAGQEKFKSLIPSYIKDSQAIVVVYDITSRESFLSVEKWMQDARELRDVDQAIIVLAGNKADLVDDELVDS